ncbi:hypothetical protein BH23CHL7_BH23CHL7_04660 [soil metagenome]
MSTLSAPARSRPSVAHAERGGVSALRDLPVAAATALIVLALALLPLLTPLWIHPAMSAAGGAAAGATLEQSLRLSNRTVNELLFGSGAFGVRFDDGRPLYGSDEIGHMQDVRLVLFGFLGLAVVAIAGLALVLATRRSQPSTWRAIGRGAGGLVIGVVLAGTFAALAFGPAFELFHRLLFPGGNWAFDPAQSNLVSLYPLGFWQLSAAAFGLLAASLGVAVWLLARRRRRRLERST